ncbi:MAG: hypothetical protein ACFCVE_01800 [Phycisphaerae bacterium]
MPQDPPQLDYARPTPRRDFNEAPRYDGSDTFSPVAAASLIFGLLILIPWLAGFIAIACGAVVFRDTTATRRDRLAGTVGLALGFINLAVWTTFLFTGGFGLTSL